MKNPKKKLDRVMNLTGITVLLTGFTVPLAPISQQDVYAATNPDISNKSSSPYSLLYGSGYWTTSSIREWLNSEDGVGNVVYTNEAPNQDKIGSDAYDQEAGFLYEFSQKERDAIAVTERRNFVYSTLSSSSRDGGSGNPPRYDGLVPSDNLHISSPNIDKVWKNLGYQTMKEKVFLLGTNEIFEYVQKRGFPTKKGLSERAMNRFNISGSSYQYATSSPNYSNSNSEAIWGMNSNGYGTAINLTNKFGIAPAIHLKPDYTLLNGKKARELSIGDVVSFGTYDGATVEWRVINMTPEGYPLLWAEDSVTIKRYDAPGDYILKDSVSVNFPTADISIKDDLKFTNGTSDITPPALHVVDDTALNERQNNSFALTIKATDEGSGVSHIILPNGDVVAGDTVNYQFTDNKRYYFTAVDKAGNHYGFEVPVGNINPPAAVIVTPSANGWTNKDVKVDIKTTQANTDWYDSQRAITSGYTASAFPEYTSYAGKRYRLTGEVRKVFAKDDNYNALIRMMYDQIIPFGDNYRVARTYPSPVSIPLKNLSTKTFTSFDETFTVGGNYFGKLTPYLDISHGSIENGNYKVEFRNVAVELLDKEDFRIEKIMLPNGNDILADSYVDTLSEEGTYKYQVLDSRGKTTEKTVEVKIDKVKPQISISGNPTEDTDEDVVLKINATDDRSGVKRVKKPNGEWDNRSSFTYNVYENGTYTFTVEDNAGNQASKTVTVSNIDDTPPTLDFELSEEGWTNREVSIIAKASDNVAVETVRTPDGSIVNGSSATFEVSRNGNYEFEATDTNGNKTVKNITVSNIDTIEPSLQIEEINRETGQIDVKLEYRD